MINLIDLAVVIFILFFLLRRAGGIAKTIKNLLAVFLLLLFFGIATRLLLSAPLPGPANKTLKDSYFVNLSYILLKWTYPAVEKNVPKVDSFMREKVLSSPTPEAVNPAVLISPKALPKLSLPDLPKLK